MFLRPCEACSSVPAIQAPQTYACVPCQSPALVEKGNQADLDTRVLAALPLDGCTSGLLQYWVLFVIADHVIRLHQLLVAEVRVLGELKDDLEALQTKSCSDRSILPEAARSWAAAVLTRRQSIGWSES